MDEKKNNIRLVKTGSRRVTKTTTEYDWNSLDRKMKNEQASRQNQRTKSAGAVELEQKVRYQKQQKQKRLKMKRQRMLLVLILTVALVLVLLFLTPVFNIRSVSVDGNRIVTAEQFQEKLSPLVGENLFRTGGGKIRRTLKEIPYIDTVETQKKLFPPSVMVNVTEYMPAGLIRTDGRSLIVNRDLHVLSDEGEPYPVPVLTGLGISGYELGGVLKTDNSEKEQILSTALGTLESVGLIDKVMEINVSDIANVTMNYEDRLTVNCGTQLDLEHKLRLLKETIARLEENTRGTIDLSEPGRAVHIP